MPDPTASALVAEVLALRASHPHAPAIDVLDLVMQERRPWLEDFLEHMVPPSPFALLVAEAFDWISLGEWKALTSPAADEKVRAAMRQQYASSVLPKFVRRYGFSYLMQTSR